jgi:hypothetical protein
VLAAIALSLLFAVTDGTVPRLEEVSPKAAPAYTSAIRIVSLADGNRAVIHPVDDPLWKAIVVSLIRQNVETVFKPAQWLVTEPLVPGTAGQVFTIAPLRNGQAVASVAWVDASRTIHMDLVVLDAVLHARSHFEVPGGVRDVAAGPGSTLLAVTFDATRHQRTKDAPLLELFSTDGKKLAEFLSLEPSVSVPDGIAIVHQARLIENSGHYALLDAVRHQAILFHFGQASDGSYVLVRDSQYAIDASPAGVSFASFGTAAATMDGETVTIVRQGYQDHAPATLVLRYVPGGSVTLVTSLRPPLNSSFWEGGVLKGVFQSGDVTAIQTAEVPQRPTH